MTRTHRTVPLLVAGVALLALSACGNGGPAERTAAPSTDAPAAAVPPVAAPAAAPKAAPKTTKKTTKTPSAASAAPKKASAAPRGETMVFALLSPSAADVRDDYLAVVNYDKLTYDPDCDVPIDDTGWSDQRKFDECWSNSSTRTRTVVVDKKTDTTFLNPNNPDGREGVFPDELPIILGPEGQSLGRAKNDVSVWRIDIHDGHATSLTELGPERLSLADESWAELNL